MKKFFFDIFSNPDSVTFSSKRAGGFISLFSTILFGHLELTEPMIVMSGLTVAFFGLSTIDYKAYIKQEPTPIDHSTGETPVNP